MRKNPFMHSLSEGEGKKRVLEKYGRREILLVNNNQPLRGIKTLHEMRMGLTVKEMKDLFDHLPYVKIGRFTYRIMP